MSKLYKEQKNTTYRIAKELGVKPATLYRYPKKVDNVNSMSARILFGIADIEGMDPKELWLKMKDNARESDVDDKFRD